MVIHFSHALASFPGPAQLFVTCSTKAGRGLGTRLIMHQFFNVVRSLWGISLSTFCKHNARLHVLLPASTSHQVLIATSTLAWGVNFPAHLVVVKGTEYFDGKTQHYVDYPITDVLQMMGRAGRPQYDDRGVAMILVHDIKKHFYKKFLYEPFPVESK